jgi:hypothetical protein
MSDNEKPKRKTTTSSQVKRRYNDKTYSRIYADLPKELVADFRQAVQERGTYVATVLKSFMEEYLAENPPKGK